MPDSMRRLIVTTLDRVCFWADRWTIGSRTIGCCGLGLGALADRLDQRWNGDAHA